MMIEHIIIACASSFTTGALLIGFCLVPMRHIHMHAGLAMCPEVCLLSIGL